MSAPFVAIGQPIRTLDRLIVGEVLDVTATHLRVRGRFRRSYWLGRDAVLHSDSQGIILRCDKGGLQRMRLRYPWQAQSPESVPSVTR